MEGRIRSSENLEKLLLILQNAKKEKMPEPQRKMKIYKSKPEFLDDDELMQAANELRKERAALAAKLVDAGLLDPSWTNDKSFAGAKSE